MHFQIAFKIEIFSDYSLVEILTCTSIPLMRDQKVPIKMEMMGVGILKDSFLIVYGWMGDCEVGNFEEQ